MIISVMSGRGERVLTYLWHCANVQGVRWNGGSEDYGPRNHHAGIQLAKSRASCNVSRGERRRSGLENGEDISGMLIWHRTLRASRRRGSGLHCARDHTEDRELEDPG